MSANPLLKKLGLSNNDRAVIFHADDIGMSQSSLAAYKELIDYGLLSSAATMVPCGWFPATAVYCRENQNNHPHIDMGVHLTLTSEWEGSYRWGPISTRDKASGMIDNEGYFHSLAEPVQKSAKVDAVRREVEGQIDTALSAGIDATHIDSHMGTLFHEKFLQIYLETALKYQLPALMFRSDALRAFGHITDENALAYFQQLEDNGFPLLDGLEMMSLDQPENRIEEAKQRLENLPIGVSYFIIHPSTDTPEIRAIAPDWENRVADYELFLDDNWQKAVEASGVKVIGWRVLRDLIRQ